MSQQNGFGGGFILGSIIGGVVGGLLGTALATRNDKQISDQENSVLQKNATAIAFSSEESIELARHGLEDKIAQLNSAIDDVRHQLDSVKANSSDGEV